MSKYEPLWNWLRENGKEEYKLSYEEMREIMGFELDHSFLNYIYVSATPKIVVKSDVQFLEYVDD